MTHAPQPENNDSSGLPTWAAFTTMGLSMAACVTIGVVLGLWADAQWHTSPLMLFVGLIAGVMAAAASVISLVRRYL